VLIATAQCSVNEEIPTDRKNKTLAEEPFDSFRVLDGKLTSLQRQFADVQEIVPEVARIGAIDNAKAEQWRSALQATALTAASIENLARRQKTRCLRTRQAYGARLFRSLEQRAFLVRKPILELQGKLRTEEMKPLIDEASKSILSLIQQYQAVSAGYENVHCVRAQWPCCLPKKVGKASYGCKCQCVQRPATCRKGFRGTRVERNARPSQVR